MTSFSHHPIPIRLFNALQQMLDPIGALPRLDVEMLIRAARKKTGLTDFGEEWFREPLAVLIQSINEEANLSSLGRVIVHKRLLDALMIRLRAERWFKEYPEILDIDLGHILVIAGLQRTGTTLLHRLLASDPRMRAPLSWEALNPVPLDDEWAGGKLGPPKTRISQARMAQRGLKYIAPTFFAIHPIEYDMPEEDILLLDLSFMSQTNEATMRVPTYARWLETQDSLEAYRYLKKLMQLLMWQRPAQNTVLKSPHHMEYLDTVLKIFPDATVIQTHRDPQKTMPSFVSMVCHGAGVFSDDVDARVFSDHWQRKVMRMIDRSNDARTPATEARFLDVSYYDVVASPINQLKRIYDVSGLVFDAAVEVHARDILARQVQNKYGRHIYRMEDFGLSEKQIERDFGAYRERYAIPFERKEGVV